MENYDNNTLMEIQFILEVYVYRRRYKKTLWSLFMNSTDMYPAFVPRLVCRLQI